VSITFGVYALFNCGNALGNAEFEGGSCKGKRVGTPSTIGVLKARLPFGLEDGTISLYGGESATLFIRHCVLKCGWTAWARGHEQIKLSPPFTLIPEDPNSRDPAEKEL
jgi:hypothetical protein